MQQIPRNPRPPLDRTRRWLQALAPIAASTATIVGAAATIASHLPLG